MYPVRVRHVCSNIIISSIATQAMIYSISHYAASGAVAIVHKIYFMLTDS